MSGVVGWIDFSRDLIRDRPIVTALTATLAQRGPDSEAVWVSPRAAFGYRTLAAEPNPRPQPFVLTLGESPVAAAVTGAPSGLAELRGRLVSAGVAVAPAAGAAELIARAYLEWDTEFVPWLGGTFAIAVWDGRNERVLLARDRIGGQSLFYTHTPTGLLFASERKTLLAHPEVASVVDASGLREAIAHALPAGGIFAGFGEIQPAEVAVFDRGGWARRRYWALRTQAHQDDYDTTVARVRALLDESVAASMPDDPARMFLTLSGGIDSSSVAGLIAGELRRRGQGRLRTFTVDFTHADLDNDIMRDTKDEPFARAVADFIDAEHTVVQLPATDLLDPIVRLGMLRSKDYPTRIYDMDTSQYVFLQYAAAATGGKIVFGGGAGDQVFRGARWSTERDLVESDTFPWLALPQRYGAVNGFGTGLLNADALAALDFPTYYRDEYTTVVAEVEYLPEETEWERAVRRAAYLVLTRFRVDTGPFSATGLQVRAPINSPELIEYAYNVPAEMHSRGGREKSVLRAAVADLLPDQVLQRRQSATPVSTHPSYAQRLGDELKAILADPQAPVRSLIDLRQATELANQPDRLANDRMARADIELTLQLNLWLDDYRVRLAL